MSRPFTVYVDFKSDNAHLAQPGIQALAAEFALTLDWQPLRVAARTLPAPRADESVGERHARVREEYRRSVAKRYAHALGLPLQYPADPAPTDTALMGLAWLNRSAPDAAGRYVEAAFDAYWGGAAIADAAAVTALLERLGLATDGFDTFCANEGDTALEAVRDAALERGIIEVPGFFVDDEPWVGREHLPMLRWLLGGRDGPAPGVRPEDRPGTL